MAYHNEARHADLGTPMGNWYGGRSLDLLDGSAAREGGAARREATGFKDSGQKKGR